MNEDSSIPVCCPAPAHDVMPSFVPGLDRAVKKLAAAFSRRRDWDEMQTVRPEDLLSSAEFSEFAMSFVRHLVRDKGAAPDQAMDEGDLLGHHVFYLVNLWLHRHKVFWVDESLAFLFDRTALDIDGNALKLTFPACAFVYTDSHTLGLADAVVRLELGDREQTPDVLTAYVIDQGPERDGRMIQVSLLVDYRNGEWPFLVSRELFVRPEDNLADILASRVPDGDPGREDPFFVRSEIVRLLHLVLNSVLFSTSAHLEPIVIRSPLRSLERQAARKGPRKREKLLRRLQRLRQEQASSDVYYLPGKIEISQIRCLREFERTGEGHQLMKRFMVRGHWRRPNPDWKEQHLRWITPYWKGPDMASVIEREYRLKP